MLRLKGEAEEEILDEEPGHPDLITARDAFPEDDFESVEEDADEKIPGRSTPLLRGLGIATATFLPTFLAILFGLPYLLDSATPDRTPSVIIPSVSEQGPRATPPRSKTIPDPFVAPRAIEPPARRPSDPKETAPKEAARLPESPREAKAVDAPPVRVEPAPPTLPESQPRTAEPRKPEPPRQVTAPRPAPERAPRAEPPPPAAEAKKAAGDWAPAAAFTDRDAANRLASSIQQQGYPVEIRQDRSSTRPWVVWIGAEPRGGGIRRR